MGDKRTCGDFGGRTQSGEPCGRPSSDGRCRDHSESHSSHSRAQYDLDKVCRVIRAKDGNLSEAARAIGCNRKTLTRYADRYDEVAEALEDARAGLVDLAESELRNLIKEGDFGAIRFALRCWGDKRGWSPTDRLDVTSDGEKVEAPPVLYYPDTGRRRDEGD